MANAVAGDTWVFLAGTYHVGPQGADYRMPVLNPSSSGTAANPIVFQSESPRAAVLHGTGSGAPSNCSVIGANGRNYIVWDGFRITSDTEASVFVYNATGVVIRNSEVVGFSESNSGANVAGIKLESATNALIQNNSIHGHQDPTGNHNTAGLWTQNTNGVIVERNTFANNSVNIYSKYGSTNDIYRFNLLLPITETGVSNGNANLFVQNYLNRLLNLSIYQNIVIGGAFGIGVDMGKSPGSNSYSVYNNTIHGPRLAAITQSDVAGYANSWSAWNNIVYLTQAGTFVQWQYPGDNPAFLNFNQYFIASGTPSWRANIYSTSCVRSTLLGWTSDCGGFDSQSVVTDPGFANPGGTSASDYKRSSYPAIGRGGIYSGVMGAYISGGEQIGANW